MIEYLLVYRLDGHPIFSKCFTGFCEETHINEELFIGFIRALETLPRIIGVEQMNSIDMGNTKLVFTKTKTSKLAIVVGIPQESDLQAAQELLKSIQALVEKKYRQVNWQIITIELFAEFKKDLFEILGAIFHKYESFEDHCPLGEHCPFRTTAIDSDIRPIWSRIRALYDETYKSNPT